MGAPYRSPHRGTEELVPISHEEAPARRSIGRIVLAILFALFAIAAWMQVVFVPLGMTSDPPALTLLQALIGAAAAAAAWGSWSGTWWAPWAALLYGLVTAVMLIALGPLLGLPPDSRWGMWAGAVSVVLLALAAGSYLGRRAPSPH
jgi:peptidoglycan/LPS O-acetylase OafA/YrhL